MEIIFVSTIQIKIHYILSFNNQNKYIGQLNMNTDELKIIDMPDSVKYFV